MKRVLVVGAADTKGEEFAYLRSAIAEAGASPVVVDVAIGEPRCAVDITRHEITAHSSGSILEGRDRGAAVAALGEAFASFLAGFEPFDAIIGIGGGTSIVTRGMRTLPIGLPKLMVSTLASGDVAAYVDVSDIAMTPSVTDLAGLSSVSRVVLRNAAFVIAGMAAAGAARAQGMTSTRPSWRLNLAAFSRAAKASAPRSPSSTRRSRKAAGERRRRTGRLRPQPTEWSKSNARYPCGDIAQGRKASRLPVSTANS